MGSARRKPLLSIKNINKMQKFTNEAKQTSSPPDRTIRIKLKYIAATTKLLLYNTTKRKSVKKCWEISCAEYKLF